MKLAMVIINARYLITDTMARAEVTHHFLVTGDVNTSKVDAGRSVLMRRIESNVRIRVVK